MDNYPVTRILALGANFMSQKTLPAITAEINRDFVKKFFDGDLHYLGASGEITISNMESFLRAALLKVAEETVAAVMPEEGAGHWEMDTSYCIQCGETQENLDHHASWNAARKKMNANFKTFINQ